MSEIHGYTDVTLHRGTVVRDPENFPFFGVTLHAVPVEKRAQHKADRETCDTAARSLTKAELAAYLTARGRFVFTDETKADLAMRASNLQMDEWWPKRIVKDLNQ